MRGTLSRDPLPAAEYRFIPACAGNTRDKDEDKLYDPVHPRVCGEHCGRIANYVFRYGSSPRVRGTLVSKPRYGCPMRFIPACAGNTVPAQRFATAVSVHPRVCGEHNVPVVLLSGGGGSSPRVRGTLLMRSLDAAKRRFIPACAGNT